MISYNLIKISFFSLSYLIFSGCALQGRLNSSETSHLNENSADSKATAVPSEYRISLDRKQLEELRKDVPVEKRQTNDELAIILSTIGNGERNSYKIREDWQNILRKKRNLFDESVKKQRNEYSRNEKSKRDIFIKKLEKDRHDFQKKKVTSEERSEFYQQIENQRREYFSEEQSNRSQFEAEIRDKRSEFEDYIREKNNLFNDELRSSEKREELRKKEELKLKASE